MITIFCIHPKGFNVGNDAIQVALRDLVHQSFGRVVNLISLPAVSKYESHGKAGLTAQTIHEINRFGDGVIIGGGNLYENGELTVSESSLNALEPPMMLFSLSRGRVYNRRLELASRSDAMPDSTIEALHRTAFSSIARDPATYDYLTALGCEGATLAGCPTLFLGQSIERLPKLPPSEDPGVLISIRNPSLMNVPLHVQAGVQKDIESIIDFLRAQDVGRIRLLCHDVRDVEFATVFQASRKVDFVYTNDVYWYLALLRSAKLNVSYRLHATLPCISYGTPTIKISYDERALSIMEYLGLGQWNINLVKAQSLLSDVIDRYQRLGELELMISSLQARWDGIRALQVEQMQRFARKVETYARGMSMK